MADLGTRARAMAEVALPVRVGSLTRCQLPPAKCASANPSNGPLNAAHNPPLPSGITRPRWSTPGTVDFVHEPECKCRASGRRPPCAVKVPPTTHRSWSDRASTSKMTGPGGLDEIAGRACSFHCSLCHLDITGFPVALSSPTAQMSLPEI